ncbi:MAG TPA: ABC transporter permease, partial [Longimicrobiales bacterium]|nr:ABC transporter permease [Longimicrobiales bacterium]
MSTRFLAAYAARSLRRGGQRSLLAIVCIAFGVLALVAMQLLAHVVGRATNVEPRLQLGGDLLIRSTSGSVTELQRELLASFVREGVLSGVATFAADDGRMIRGSGSGRVQLVGRAIGVSRAFPLAGAVQLAGGGELHSVLERPGSVVLTRDLARALEVAVGDTVRFGGLTREPARLVVGGIARSVPDRRGQTMLYSLETARLLAGDRPLVHWAAATAR